MISSFARHPVIVSNIASDTAFWILLVSFSSDRPTDQCQSLVWEGFVDQHFRLVPFEICSIWFLGFKGLENIVNNEGERWEYNPRFVSI